MSKTGFITHKGIQQVFTTGPSQGSTVVNGYSINGVLQGPTVNHNQPFIEGSVESINANNTLWRRKFEDQTQCAIDCNAPVLSSVVSNCSTNTFTLVSSNVNTSISPSTIIEVSLSPTGFPFLQRYTRNNTNGNNTYNVDITSLGIIRGTTIYFRLINLCNNGNIESSPSNILSSLCISCCAPTFTVTQTPITALFTGTTDELTFNLNYGACSNIVESLVLENSVDNGNSWNRIDYAKLDTLIIAPFLAGKYRFQSVCSGIPSPYSTIYDYIPTPAPPPPTQNYSLIGPHNSADEACTAGNLAGALLGFYTVTNDSVIIGSTVFENPIFGTRAPLTGAPGWYAITTSFAVFYTPIRIDNSGVIVEVGGGCAFIGTGGDVPTTPPIDPGFGSKIICDLLYRQGYLPKEIWEADEKFGRLMLKTNKKSMFGYLTWAKPVVKFLTKNPQYSKYFYLITKPWSEHMAYQMGVLPKDNKLGKVIHYIGNKFSLAVYELITSRRKRRKK
jgi:hypothetical protein